MADTTFKLNWDVAGEKKYETGVDHGVLYTQVEPTTGKTSGFGKGVAWNGLTSVTESPSGAEATPLYADNIKYLNLVSAEEFGATIEAYTYPDDFMKCLGYATLDTNKAVIVGQQARETFGMAYRTYIGDDTKPAGTQLTGANPMYKIHLIYNCLAAPSESAYSTVNDSPEAISFSWEVSTTPINVTGKKPTASLVIDCSKLAAEKVALLEKALYGTAGTSGADAYLPTPDEVLSLIA